MAKLQPLAVWGVLRDLRATAENAGPLVVGGALAEQLGRELSHGAAPGAVRTAGSVEGASVLVRVLAGAPSEEDERELRAASRAGVPVVAVQTARESFDVPYVLATDVVACSPGAGFPVEALARVIAGRLGDDAIGLAARVPALRDAVTEALVERFSRQNGIAGVAIFIPGADFPVLTLNQIRLVLRLAAAHGVELDQSRVPEVLATVGAGLGFRTLARTLLGIVPVAGWAVRGAVAYGGTRALGEAAKRYFAQVAESAGADRATREHP